jgi:methylenetetrahydrofolate reductase (NADPH)
MPLTTVRTLRRGPELSGAPLPASLVQRLDRFADDAPAFRAAGLDVTTELCARLLDEGVQALHFYTLNRSTATSEIVHRLGLAPRRPVGAAAAIGAVGAVSAASG